MQRIIFDSWGQMCNRLWEYLDQVAWAYKKQGKVYSLFWDYSLEDFDQLRNCSYIKFPLYIKFRQDSFIARLYRRVLYAILCNRSLQKVYSSQFFKKRGFVSGRDILYQREHYPEVWNDIKYLFAPNKSISDRIDQHFADVRLHNPDCLIVGVHIRRGDYKEFCNGQYYYNDEEYAGFMREVVKMMESNVLFFISSNETIDRAHFNGLKILDIRNKKPAEDMYSLTACDYIMGPYSSFSSWASFYGKIPYCRLDRHMVFTKDKFKIVESFGRSMTK